ncbi:hypothetical protein DUNSADRAFT_15001 [Dunaliella salina]|uniref:IFT80 second beta-propeller domain-containing protein n=1 Tax=Dunaliella salina TaxID=3046 RepID=A0ABQ7G690_DUNSA|nr:hypothetical protein DUNSADRAFT_15001 [Dunaliella salina]|eukprot:KAF5830135.1 hypothetical protein DUNSADRAFT_15001 [Dunaliella salina]
MPGGEVVVVDLLSEIKDDLEFRDRVVKISLGFDHLIVATSTQCHVYSISNLSTPCIFDLKEPVTLVMQVGMQGPPPAAASLNRGFAFDLLPTPRAGAPTDAWTVQPSDPGVEHRRVMLVYLPRKCCTGLHPELLNQHTLGLSNL